MANPEVERTTINVKSVRAEAWEAARKAASQRGEPMGEWLSHAILAAVKLQAGDTVLPPGQAEISARLSDAVTTLAPALSDIGSMTREARSSVCQLLDDYARAARGLPPRRGGKERGQSSLQIGQSRVIPQIEGSNVKPSTHPDR